VITNSQSQTSRVPGLQKPPKLREARVADHAQIAALASKYRLSMEDYAGWAHLWTDNPAYRGIKGDFPIGWVLEASDGTISGYLGNVPANYEFEGKTLLSAATRAWVVDEAFRPYSPLLLGTYFQQKNVDLFLSSTVNAQSEPAYSVFQGLHVPVGVWDRALFWITDYVGFTASFLRRSGRKLPEALSYPLSAGLFLRDRLRRSALHGHTQGKVNPCPAFDDRFDAFWTVLRKQKSNLLLAVRSREALEWHFKFALLQNTAWIYTAESNSGLTAYAIFLRNDYKDIGLTRMRLVDFQCLVPEQAPALLSAMLEAAAERCRHDSIHMLELIGLMPPLERTLLPAHPHQRPLSTWLYCYKANNPALAKKLSDPAVWEPWLFDGDSSLS
jgi:hypothetical protein